jgi:uncharacterized protein (TIGR02147 family)
LRDYYEFKKSGPRGYSFRAFSKAAGFSSPNLLKLVMDGERNLSRDAAQKFAKGLGLTGTAAEYFVTLVEFNQAKLDNLKEGLLLQLKKLIPYKNRRNLGEETFQYLSHWIYPVAREMILLKEFRDDPYWISRQLVMDVQVEDISSAIRFLLKGGFIRKDEQGHYQVVDNMISSPDEIANLAVRNFHRQMLDQAKQSLEKLGVQEREFNALTLVLPESGLPELKSKIKAFVKEVHEWAVHASEAQSNDAIVQVNIQMYPHTRGYRK